MIYTSRYSNKAIGNDRHFPVGISVGKPRFKIGYELRDQCYALAPRSNMLKMDEAEYRGAYTRKIEDLGTEKIIRIVRGLEQRASAEGKDLVLLCFEDIRKPGSWCHRTIFAEWWRKKTGEEIQELLEAEPLKKSKKAAEPKAEEAEQMSLYPP